MSSRLLSAALALCLACSFAHADEQPAKRTVTVGFFEFPPYSWTDAQGQPQGNLLAFTERLLRKAGYQGRYRSLPGARLYAGLRDGSVELWPGASGKRELEGHVYEARNVLKNFDLVLYRRPNAVEPVIPDDLYQSRMIVISGYNYWQPVNDLLDNPALKIQRFPTRSHSSALAMLLRNRGDYLLDYREPIDQAVRDKGLAPLPYTLMQSLRGRLIASRHAPGAQQLLDELDQAFDELRAAGELPESLTD